MTEATKRPWTIKGGQDALTIWSEQPMSIGGFFCTPVAKMTLVKGLPVEEMVSNAELIVTAVNAYNPAKDKAWDAMKAAHEENARLLALVTRDLTGRIDASKMGALTACLDRSLGASSLAREAEGVQT